ncbi:hypothetical protein ELS83_04545 [Marinifilum sp. JC070]|uniref:Uncharacterized protein n=2 Tax=Marinifilum caeruleilacunae TaxID=2499076 RepID=A0ABX1WSK3_9BACT|nr:hypothetical protein [Marinifilum caeruleilacunae]
MRKLLTYFGHLLAFLFLTILSQVGGLVYITSMLVSRKIKAVFPTKRFIVFMLLYAFTSILIVPFVAPWFGREKIENNSNLQAVSYATILLNRNYVSVETQAFMQAVSGQLHKEHPEIEARYLDACFPFWDGFPLFPHLSHNDGCKIDFSLVYENGKGQIINQSKSISGYGVFEDARKGEVDQCKLCQEQGYFQYDYPKYLTFGRINQELKFSEKGTKVLIDAILAQASMTKMFIEPHLKQRLKISDERVRFHGCRSVRHDDHIHVQIN